MGAIRNEIGRWIIWLTLDEKHQWYDTADDLMWMGINCLLFALAYIKFDTSKEYYYLRIILKDSLAWARASAAVLNFNCMLILLPVCRNLISFIRGLRCGRIGDSIIRRLDKNLTFHRHVAYMIIIQTAIHVGAHVYNFERFAAAWDTKGSIDYQLSSFDDTDYSTWLNPIRSRGVDPNTELIQTIAGISGVVITLALIVMFTSSTELLRRSYFEIFWYTHHLFIVFYIGLVVHGLGGLVRKQVNVNEHDPLDCKGQVDANINCPQPRFEPTGAKAWQWVLGPMVLYILERFIRFLRSLQTVKVVQAICHPSDVLEIRMKKSAFNAKPGQYIFMKCTRISNLEWHPFTLTSCPEEDYFSVHIRVAGDWTRDLVKSFQINENETALQETPRLAVDGPFGTSSTDFTKYPVCLFVGGGIGITPFASILKSIWYQHSKSESSLEIKKVYLFWICPDTKAFEWFADLLESLEVQMVEKGNADFLEYNIYLTRGWTQNEARNIMLRDKDQGEDVITGLKQKTSFGRPQWSPIFSKIVESHPRTNIGVFFCGPPALSHTLHIMCNKHTNTREGIRFFYNKENF